MAARMTIAILAGNALRLMRAVGWATDSPRHINFGNRGAGRMNIHGFVGSLGASLSMGFRRRKQIEIYSR